MSQALKINPALSTMSQALKDQSFFKHHELGAQDQDFLRQIKSFLGTMSQALRDQVLFRQHEPGAQRSSPFQAP